MRYLFLTTQFADWLERSDGADFHVAAAVGSAVVVAHPIVHLDFRPETAKSYSWVTLLPI